MDPIDLIAERYALYCADVVRVYSEIVFIMDCCQTQQEGLAILEKMNYLRCMDPKQVESARVVLERFRMTLEALDDIRSLAKKVFIYNFYERDSLYVFNKEVSFSYACKMLSHGGPLLRHFSRACTQKDIVDAELLLAWRTPSFQCDVDLYCLEYMHEEDDDLTCTESSHASSPVDSLMCSEEMPGLVC